MDWRNHRIFLAVIVLLVSVDAPVPAASYQILFHSPDSWADYYRRIGLGTVERGPFTPQSWNTLTAHCRALEEITGLNWIPLGYSRERGYRLCFRTGPYSQAEAKVLCARLSMNVREHGAASLVCG